MALVLLAAFCQVTLRNGWQKPEVDELNGCEAGSEVKDVHFGGGSSPKSCISEFRCC